MIELNVYSREGKIVDKKNLPEEIFEVEPNDEVIYEAIRMYRFNERKGTASTKTRGEVRGGGRKPWPQKKLGRARAGSIRSPLWEGGGVTFGPKPRNYHYRIPKKKLKLALLSTIAYKAKEGKILLMEELKLDKPRTKLFYSLLEVLRLNKKTLFAPQAVDKMLYLSSRNVENVTVKPAKDINALDVAQVDTVVFTLDGLNSFIERMKG